MKKDKIRIAPVISTKAGSLIRWRSFPMLNEYRKRNAQVARAGRSLQDALRERHTGPLESSVLMFLEAVFRLMHRESTVIRHQVREELYWFSYALVEDEENDTWRISSDIRSIFADVLGRRELSKLSRRVRELQSRLSETS